MQKSLYFETIYKWLTDGLLNLRRAKDVTAFFHHLNLD